jgi:hypothetical protein
MLADDVRSFYVKPEDKQNIPILQKARPGVSLRYIATAGGVDMRRAESQSGVVIALQRQNHEPTRRAG